MKPGTAIRKVLIITSFLTSLVLLVVPAIAEATIMIDATGGDCVLPVGKWTGSTCTLAMDLADNIQIMSDGITLDGAGHLLLGVGDAINSVPGVYLEGRTGVTVMNVQVEGFFRGILLYRSHGNLVMHNTAGYNYSGIDIDESSNNVVIGNVVHSGGEGVFLPGGSHNNQIIGNISYDNGCCGVNLSECSVFGGNDNNLVMGNTAYENMYFGVIIYGSAAGTTIQANILSANGETGLHLDGGDNTIVHDNDIVNNYEPLFLTSGTTTFSSNYWSTYDDPIEGCFDPDDDGDCDDPYIFPGGEDAEASLYSMVLAANTAVRPTTVDLRTRTDVKAYLEMPGYDLALVDMRTVAIHTTTGVVWAEPLGTMGDFDKDRVPDLLVKFNVDKFRAASPAGANLPVWVTGVIGDRTFEGGAFINVLK